MNLKWMWNQSEKIWDKFEANLKQTWSRLETN